ncbi:hypothetical protein Nepgr_018392 [Nepenthes gracilis]|uniref:TFIIS N-terminal domain-containing protein n=1 Tax=Nepenthes gracilis TaxID=150966 RepID=A0AAD3SUT1_NEPGR|nr:hypothetical protein Nepgr_018392 [Nepenthes gracilis]
MKHITLEDFFTLTEMKDGFTSPVRVEELVAVMQKEKHCTVKNVSDATRQWSAVASVIAATKDKDCLDLFVKLDGLWFISRWLKDAQKFAADASDCLLEESISALLQAFGKLQVDKEELISSGIWATVRDLLSHQSTSVQQRARDLVDVWKLGHEGDAFHLDAEDVVTGFDGGMDVSDKIAASFSVCSEVDTPKPLLNNEHDASRAAPDDDEDVVDAGSDFPTADVKLDHEVHLLEGTPEGQSSQDAIKGNSEAKSDVLKSQHSVDDIRQINENETFLGKAGKEDVSSASDVPKPRDISEANSEGAPNFFLKPDGGTNSDDRNSSVVKSTSLEVHMSIGKSSSGMNDCLVLQNCTTTLEPKLTKSTMSKMSDMDLEYGTIDALEIARLVANEVERQVGNYDEQSGSSSERIVRGSITQLDSVNSMNGKQHQHIEGVLKELPSVENHLSAETSPPTEDFASISSVDAGAGQGKFVQDIESSQVTDAAQEQETNIETGMCGFDLNQELCFDDDDQMTANLMSNVVVSASRASAAPGMLELKGSAATSAFQLASPLKNSDGHRAPFDGGGTSSGSRQRQDSLVIDLNMADGGEDYKVADPMTGEQNPTVPGLPSCESSVEPSPRKTSRPKFDLNKMSEDADATLSHWKLDRRPFVSRHGHRSPSPASSSSSMKPLSSRNFDLNHRPLNDHLDPLELHPFVGETSSHKVNAYGPFYEDSFFSIMGARVNKNIFPLQSPPSLPNGRASEFAMDPDLPRARHLFGSYTANPYAHSSVYGINGLATGPVLSSLPPMYGPNGSIPYTVDSSIAHILPQITGSALTVPPSYSQSPVAISMMGSLPISNRAGLPYPLHLNSAYLSGGVNRELGVARQLFNPSPARPMREQQHTDNFLPSWSVVGGKQKEPDGGREPYLANYKRHQPPHS